MAEDEIKILSEEDSPSALLLAMAAADKISNDEDALVDACSDLDMGEVFGLTESREWRPSYSDGHKAQVIMVSNFFGCAAAVLARSTVPDKSTGFEPKTTTYVFDYEEALWFARAILRLDRRAKEEQKQKPKPEGL